MKVLIKKLKRTKLSVRLIYYFVFLFYLVTYIMFTRSLLLLSGIETTIRIIIIITLGTILLLYWFVNLLMLLTKHYKLVIAASVFVTLISCVCLVGSLYINRAYSLIGGMTEEKYTTYTTDLITLAETKFENSSDFKVGIIDNDSDVEGNELAYELIDEEGLDKITIEKYDTYFEMLEYLYDGTLSGMFVGDTYVDTYSTYDQYETIETDTKVAYTYSKKMKTQTVIETSNADVTEPFTILLIGVDSEKTSLNFNSGFNSDTLMMVTFNPKTLSATVFSIPRDTYVPICNKGFSSKINSASAYGGSCVVKTVENLTGISIDFYAMINFEGVVDLVDALGGITVDVAEPDVHTYGTKVCEQNSKRKFGSELVCMESGADQHLNGEQALAYSRCRHLYLISDFARIQHQQDVVEAMANELKNMKSVNEFYAVLESVSNNMVTNMSTASMLNLYNVFKAAIVDANNGAMINVQKTYLTGYNLNMIVNNISRSAAVYTYQYYDSSLEEIKHALNVTLEKEDPTLIKTFSFSANTTYEQTVIGKSYSSTSKNEALPNFVGKTYDYAKEWCSSRGITITKVDVTEGNSAYVSTYEDDTVLTQSVTKGTLSSEVHSIVLGVKSSGTKSTTSSTKSTSTSKKTTSEADDNDDSEETTAATTKASELDPETNE